MENSYVAVIGDIVKSKAIGDRRQVQHTLEETLKYVNNKYQEEICSKFLVTLGDEFQGLLWPSKSFYEIISDIVDKLEPVQIRFGIGFGSIDTEIKEFALGMDGNAFYKARDALLKAHDQPGHSIVFMSDACSKAMELAICTILNLLAQVRNLWTPKQRELNAMNRLGLTQNEMASRLQVSQSAISQRMRKARIWEVKEAQKNLSLILDSIFKEDNGQPNRNIRS